MFSTRGTASSRDVKYTDDTQMYLAIAEAIVSGKPWTPPLLAERFRAGTGTSCRSSRLIALADPAEDVGQPPRPFPPLWGDLNSSGFRVKIPEYAGVTFWRPRQRR